MDTKVRQKRNICKNVALNNVKNVTNTSVSSGFGNVSSLDTLAQLVTTTLHTSENTSETEVSSEPTISLKACTKLEDKKILKKRAKRKYISTGLALRLVDASRLNPKSTLKKSYFNTYHCSSKLTVHKDGTVRTNYCKSRWCMVCNSIRTAVLINDYMPIIDQWEDKYFVTLTLPNCKGRELKSTIKYMYKIFNGVKHKLRMRAERHNTPKFVGLRKLECTYNHKTDTYHPHFHFILDDEDHADELVNNWLGKVKTANIDAQDIRRADSTSVKELFKYFAKLVITVKDNDNNIVDSMIYADAMDVIFNAIKGTRTFQTFGFKKVKSKEELTGEEEESEVIAEANWIQQLGDWADSEGNLLSGYIPATFTKRLVEKRLIVRSNYHTKQIKLKL